MVEGRIGEKGRQASERVQDSRQQEMVQYYESLFASAAAGIYVGFLWVELDTGETTRIYMENGRFLHSAKGQWEPYLEQQLAFVTPEDREHVRSCYETSRLMSLKPGQRLHCSYRSAGLIRPMGYFDTIIQVQEKNGRKAATLFTSENTVEVIKEREQQKLLEEALVQAQKANRAKTAFLSHMSHDMRTPMNAIMGFSAIARSQIDNKEKVKDCLDKIIASGQHLLSLINDVLDMSRIESGKIKLQEKECSLVQICRDLKNMLLNQTGAKSLDFSMDLTEIRDEWVYVDSLKLNQVLINILGNAVKFTPDGGKVCFVLRQKYPAPKGYGLYEFLIEDTGIGMSKPFINHIFEPFEREDDYETSTIEGMGLGMAISKNIVDMMGGKLLVSSEKEYGTQFLIKLELKIREEKTEADGGEDTAEEINPEVFSGKRVLVVEDNELNREIAAEILKEAGLLVEMAKDGKEAVDMVFCSKEYYYDLILTDIQMPVMDGYEETVAIRSLSRQDAASIPIIAMTANAFEEDKALVLKCGMNDHIAKPVDMNRLFTVLAQYLLERP